MKIAVIGGGPGGYEAAILAAKKGAQVTVIEKDRVGGTCLNRGCIPTKALLAASDVLETVKESEKFGVTINGAVENNFAKTMERKDGIVHQLVSGIEFLFKSNNVTLIKGIGKLIDKNTIEVTKEDGSKEKETYDKIILATGSVPVCPGVFQYDGQKVITSDEVLFLKTPPKSIIIVGGGVIGCEIGQFLRRMGTEVTVVEMVKQILPLEDEDVSKQLLRQFKKEKMKVITGNGIAKVEKQDDKVIAELQNGKIIEAEIMLVCIGRRGYTDNLGLDAAGIATDERGAVIVNKKMETNIEGIYAIGDIVKTPLLAHVASKEGLTAVQNIFGADKEMTYKAVPRCVYTEPEVAGVGLTESDCKEQNISYHIGTFDFRALGKAQAIGKIGGFVKVICDNNDVIIGASVVGPHGTDLLTELTLAVHLGLTAEQVGDVIHAHPSLSESLMEALHDVHGESIHKV
ncbi:MAG: dihydrolipoyl dehydrogenase [Eubacteriales bacterium]